jgi:hypothetical protein
MKWKKRRNLTLSILIFLSLCFHDLVIRQNF